ncbi:mitochondrial sodium/calcium exchanger protein-like [Lineus longissimus]|uniref:mitochondrial sodium/calcium exchanger protein-like n=1 Tax=Lineus longissimus TaxID=88925 RepID=UPI00315D8AF5
MDITIRNTSTKNETTFEPECRSFWDYINSTTVCDFVLATRDCQTDIGFFNYNTLVACNVRPDLRPLVVFLLVLWWLYLLVSLGSIVETFFFPCVRALKTILRLSDNIAGVTLLAFGNGAVDVISSIAAASSFTAGETGLSVGALLGGSMFITTVCAGIVSVLTPFTSMRVPLVRDVLFLLGAIALTFYIKFDGKVTLPESIGYVGYYLGYIVVVIISRIFAKKCCTGVPSSRRYREENVLGREQAPLLGPRNTLPPLLKGGEHFIKEFQTSMTPLPCFSQIASLRKQTHVAVSPPLSCSAVSDASSGSASSDSKLSLKSSDYKTFKSADSGDSKSSGWDPQTSPSEENSAYYSVEEDGTHRSVSAANSRKYSAEENGASTHQKDTSGVGKDHMLMDFFAAICPIEPSNWDSAPLYKKIFYVMRSPVVFIGRLTIPVVDYDQPPLFRWNQMLSTIQCLTALMFMTVFTGVYTYNVADNVPIWVIAIMIGALLATVVRLTTSRHQRPIYHWVFACAGFLVSIVWIYTICSEVLNLLRMFGTVFNISKAILGFTLLAWGNGIADLVANIQSARRGYPRMAISACFGGPLFNILIGIGIPFIMITASSDDDSAQLRLLDTGVVILAFLAASLLSTLIIVPIMKFKFTRPYGAFLIFLYICFLIVVLLVEGGIIAIPPGRPR